MQMLLLCICDWLLSVDNISKPISVSEVKFLKRKKHTESNVFVSVCPTVL